MQDLDNFLTTNEYAAADKTIIENYVQAQIKLSLASRTAKASATAAAGAKKISLPELERAARLGVTTVAMIDTDSDPDLIDLPIPGNDDAMRAIEIIVRELADAVIEAKAARPDVPVIMITAYGDAETKRKAMEGGAEALLTKPIDFALLRNEIDTRVSGAA